MYSKLDAGSVGCAGPDLAVLWLQSTFWAPEQWRLGTARATKRKSLMEGHCQLSWSRVSNHNKRQQQPETLVDKISSPCWTIAQSYWRPEYGSDRPACLQRRAHQAP